MYFLQSNFFHLSSSGEPEAVQERAVPAQVRRGAADAGVGDHGGALRQGHLAQQPPRPRRGVQRAGHLGSALPRQQESSTTDKR